MGRYMEHTLAQSQTCSARNSTQHQAACVIPLMYCVPFNCVPNPSLLKLSLMVSLLLVTYVFCQLVTPSKAHGQALHMGPWRMVRSRQLGSVQTAAMRPPERVDHRQWPHAISPPVARTAGSALGSQPHATRSHGTDLGSWQKVESNGAIKCMTQSALACVVSLLVGCGAYRRVRRSRPQASNRPISDTALLAASGGRPPTTPVSHRRDLEQVLQDPRVSGQDKHAAYCEFLLRYGRHEEKPVCPGCWGDFRACVCADIRPLPPPPGVEVVLWVHHGEWGRASNTGMVLARAVQGVFASPPCCVACIAARPQLTSGGLAHERQVGRCPPNSAQFRAKNSHFGPKIAIKQVRRSQMKESRRHIPQLA